jgi:uncharacterized Zn finger protein
VSRENAAAKARRLLAEGRVRVVDVDVRADSVAAEIRGESGFIYSVGRGEGGRWSCPCAALGSRCSHVQAVQLVVAFEPRRRA